MASEQAHATTQEQTPSHSDSKVTKQPTSSSSAVSQLHNGELKNLLDQQLSTFESFFDQFNNTKPPFSHLDRFFSHDPLFSWQIRPFSLFPDVFTKSGLDYKREEVGDLFRQMKEKLMKDVESDKVEKTVTQSENKLAVRMNQKGKDANDNDFEHSSAMFFEFEPGTDKIVKGVQFFDSTTTQAKAKKSGTKI
ncbi:hypothetical protein JCM3765_006202 [Sporobolomyces pararoseus]